MATENTAGNAAFIQSEIVDLLVKPLEAASVVLAAGPRIIDSSEPVRIPRVTGGPAPQWVAEGGVIPEGDIGSDEIPALPTTLKSPKVIVRATEELMRASRIEISQLFQERIVTAVANMIDTAFLTGTGASNTVTGLTNISGANAGVFNNAEPNSLLDGLALAYADEIKPTHWFVSGADFIALRKLKDNNGRYLIESDVTKDVTYRLFGLPVIVTNKLAIGKVLLVDMGRVVVVRDIAPTVQILTEAYATTGEVGFKVSTRYDLAVTHAEAVTVLTKAA